MSIGIDVDYKNNQFEYPELTRIIGKPSTATLIVLLKEVRSNASSVHTDLGGGEKMDTWALFVHQKFTKSWYRMEAYTIGQIIRATESSTGHDLI